ncbi:MULTISPECIES: hypothetical protein [Acidianus]|uniref:Pyridine nucleotide-disulfide oxidoreductase n=1 Tax=Candidatus Acidianus copahuensis TaxID=1160895 RepID=A0A031LK90_9CREN|nr:MULTISPECIES: hypothetical protein [Acidianus]EZQ03223.1 hypothetical protein CM19_10390 [Candidatus Acidianus copahuensis]NON63415.1 hypothetical protein [Acidianus sp. RZ1]
MIAVLGSGYAGLNAFYNIRNKNKVIISEKKEFIFYTAMIRNLVEPTRYSVGLEFVVNAKIKDIDLEALSVYTDKGKIEADSIILALGCTRQNLFQFLDDVKKKDNFCISAEESIDDYLALQISLYAKAKGKNVKYAGGFLSWLGKEVEDIVKNETEKKLSLCDKPDLIFSKCEPPPFLGFQKVDSYLKVKSNIYAIGDIIYGWPKLGELAMRTGKYVGKEILRKDDKFYPIFINIIDMGDGNAIHIRSDVPWGGKKVSIKKSKIRSYMKRFIEKYYIWRKGNMGFLYYL